MANNIDEVKDLIGKARKAGVIGIMQLKCKKVQKIRSITDDGVVETHSAELVQEKAKDAPGIPVKLKIKNIPDKMFSHGAKILITFQDAQRKLENGDKQTTLDGTDEKKKTKEER